LSDNLPSDPTTADQPQYNHDHGNQTNSRTAIVSSMMFAQLDGMVEKASPVTATPSGFSRKQSFLASGIGNLLAG
jgi:hypothetical protein